MRTTYVPNLKAHVSFEDDKIVRHIRHSQELWLSTQNVPRLAAAEYLRSVAPVLQISDDQLRSLGKRVSFLDPREQGVEYQLSETKRAFDSTTVAYYQTFFNVPVWRRGISVKVKDNPARIVGSTNNSEYGLEGELPDPDVVRRFRAILERIQRSRGEAPSSEQDDSLAKLVRTLLGSSGEARNAKRGDVDVLNGRFFVYRYVSERRHAGKPHPPEVGRVNDRSLETHEPRFPTLPAVSQRIEEGRAYLVVEIIFKLSSPEGDIVWLILVEPETNSILYIEPLTQGVNGLVFRVDPMVQTGDLTITADQPNSVLNPHRFEATLNDLASPVMGTQSLTGTYVRIQNVEDPNIIPPSVGAGADFDYEARTNDFGAINAYYHQTELFRTIESLGFEHDSYFDGTTFPITVDHRGLGNVINAHWVPNGTGGTAHMCYALCDTTDTANPLGRAVDPWVHWHEMGGHGTLGDHVESGTFGFAHSAGDGLAALQMDPESGLRGVPERFRYAPFRPFTTERRFDRPVGSWAWGGGSNDDQSYGSEQILATCHFRLYRSIGGDHYNVNRRRFASRATTYLILRGIGGLTAATNPSNWDPTTMTNVPGRGAQLWCQELQDVDLENWTSEGMFGGAYNKVIRWAFERQGCYQPAGTAPPYTTAGAPPEVDVYIDDGRGGEYQFQALHWHNTSMWNRNSPDGFLAHQDPILGQTNYMYVRVRNRGTTTATNVTVRGFHCLPGAGLTWPTDFTPMAPAAGLTAASIGPISSDEVMVGPFEWIPNTNAYGHDCVLMIASAPGDPSNIDHFTPGETIEEWRLVPNDNNIGQRNVNLVPGGGGEAGLMKGLDQAVFFAGNSFRRPADMELKVMLPEFLTRAGWRLRLTGIPGDKFRLNPGEKRKITIQLVPGADFSADEVRRATDRDIQVELYGNDMPLGGMIYRLDPDKREPGGRPGAGSCSERAAELLKCLEVGDAKVKKVRVKKISVDIEMDDGCD